MSIHWIDVRSQDSKPCILKDYGPVFIYRTILVYLMVTDDGSSPLMHVDVTGINENLVFMVVPIFGLVPRLVYQVLSLVRMQSEPSASDDILLPVLILVQY